MHMRMNAQINPGKYQYTDTGSAGSAGSFSFEVQSIGHAGGHDALRFKGNAPGGNHNPLKFKGNDRNRDALKFKGKPASGNPYALKFKAYQGDESEHAVDVIGKKHVSIAMKTRQVSLTYFNFSDM